MPLPAWRENTSNLLEFWLRRQRDSPSDIDDARALMLSFRAWPHAERSAHCGLECGLFDGFCRLYGPTWCGWGESVLRRWIQRLTRCLRPFAGTWNDYEMVRWQISGEPACVVEIHRRATHLPDPRYIAVQQSAAWMAGSVRANNAEFDAALAAVEGECELCRRI